MFKKSAFVLLLFCISMACAEKLSLDKWTYIEIDNARAKWGDWAEPNWLRYFGIDFQDVNRDGYTDIVSGRYFYQNPGGTMTAAWNRIDLGFNADGMLFVDVDGDDFADVIASALPDVFWFEADDLHGNSWKAMKIGTLPPTGHNNGQGYAVADLIAGGKMEIILQADIGIYACSIPKNTAPANWQWHMIVKSGSDEGIGINDMDGDGDVDIVYGDIKEGQQENPTILNWSENPGSLTEAWPRHSIGNTENAIDRICVADMNGDDKPDVVVSEERYPGLEPDGHLWWFEATNDGWKRHKVVQQYSMNNLDVADIDKDGDMDIVTNMHKGPSLATQVWENNGNGKFTKHTVCSGKEMHLGAQLVDLDSDGDLDIVGHAWDNYEFLHVWRNDAVQQKFSWKHISTESGELPMPNGGDQQTSSCAADFDGDGAAEFMVTERTKSPAVVLYDLVDGTWQNAAIDQENLRIEAGAAVADIDGDGDLDVVFGGESQSNQVWWWENPLPDNPILSPWTRRLVKDSGPNKHHDQMFGDFDGDGQDELVFWNQGAHTLFIAEIPKKPKKAKEWEMTPVFTYHIDSEMQPLIGAENFPGWQSVNEHEGLHKCDIDGDGILDIIGGGRWFKFDNGTFIANIVDAGYTFTRTIAGQFIEGGRPEIIIVVGDGLGGMYLYEWHEYQGHKKGTGTWERSLLMEGVDNGHTLDAIDFNGDGHLDIFNAEMRFGTGNPDSEIRILLGDGQGHFKKHIVKSGMGCHEGRIADFDGDGDLDILSKPYNWKSPRVDMFIQE